MTRASSAPHFSCTYFLEVTKKRFSKLASVLRLLNKKRDKSPKSCGHQWNQREYLSCSLITRSISLGLWLASVGFTITHRPNDFSLIYHEEKKRSIEAMSIASYATKSIQIVVLSSSLPAARPRSQCLARPHPL